MQFYLLIQIATVLPILAICILNSISSVLPTSYTKLNSVVKDTQTICLRILPYLQLVLRSVVVHKKCLQTTYHSILNVDLVMDRVQQKSRQIKATFLTCISNLKNLRKHTYLFLLKEISKPKTCNDILKIPLKCRPITPLLH